MTKSNDEVVRRILDCWRNQKPIPAELMDPDVEWVNPPDAIESGTRRGHAGFGKAQSAFGRTYTYSEFNVERLVDRGDVIGVVLDVVVRGRASGIDVSQRMGFMFTLRKGRVVRFEWSNDPDALLSSD